MDRTALHPVFADCAVAAIDSLRTASSTSDRDTLETIVGMGADGTPTMHIDAVVEAAILDVVRHHRVNVLSEEAGFIDAGSALTLVVDPLDGSANAAAGVPLSCFSAALAMDGEFFQASTVWLETGRTWSGTTEGGIVEGAAATAAVVTRTTGRSSLDGAAVSLLRPHHRNRDAWWRVADRAARIRILSSSTLEAALVMQGSTDAFLDPASDTHRLVDLAAALVLLPLAGGCVLDVFERPIVFDVDQTRRWSGVVAATVPLAHELAAVARGDFCCMNDR